MPMPPKTYDEFRVELQTRLESLAAGQRRIAELILGDPEGTAFRTIDETAKLAQVHKSSLVRFATKLGFSGFPALVKLCREHLAAQAQLIQRFELAQLHGGSSDLFGAVIRHDQQNLARTFARIDRLEWDNMIRLIAEAPRVHVMGARKCLPVAQLLHYLLHQLRPGVRLVSPTPGGLVDELRDMAPSDAFVALSIRRYASDTVRAIQYARTQGLRTIALTDDPASPLIPHADMTFYVETGGVTIFRSVAAFISLVQAMSTAVAIHTGTPSRDELLLNEELFKSFQIYYSQPSAHVEP